MDHIGIDVHKKESQLCILSEEGERLESRVRTTPARFADVLGARPRAPLPTSPPTSAPRTRKIKTARRDARALAEACRLGAYRPAHRVSDAQRHVRARLTVRDALLRT